MPVTEKPLYIDIPVKLSEVKNVFSIGALEFEGDLPASIFHMQLIENDIDGWSAKSEIIAVFHTNAGHATLTTLPTTRIAISPLAIPTRTSSSICKSVACTSNFAAPPRKFTAGETRICCEASGSIPTPWRERPNSCSRDS